jgi:hypothetical protein
VPFTRESLAAQVKLAEMTASEQTAKRWEASRPGMMQETYAEAYRKTIGVHPEHRDALRSVLEELRDGKMHADVTVEKLVNEFKFK